MSRPREFDEGVVVQKALKLFWAQGYEATSVADLEEALGISRISIYNTFGDKEGLFLVTLDAYTAMVRAGLEASLTDSGLDGLEAFFRAMATPKPPRSPFHAGCMMVNTMLDLRQMSPTVKARVHGYRRMVHLAFLQALQFAHARGELRAAPVVLERRAEYLVSAMWGVMTTIRLNADTTSASATVDVLCETMAAWRTGAARP
jgi:TetR/AcrR family transcriptional regulator, transcriptional repressor for nem operon